MIQGFADADWNENAARHIASRTTCRRHVLVECEDGDPGRAEVEQFVQDAFREKHGARVRSFMPTMLAMRGDNGRLCSVAGFRCAAHEPLFLERYLSEPVENAIAAACGHAVDRAQIVEVGNLAGVTCRASLRLIVELPRLLLARGQRWIVFTASEAVRSVLAGYHAPLVQLVAAEASRVAGLGDDWGRYYETDPRVMAGFLPDGRLDRRRRGMHD